MNRNQVQRGGWVLFLISGFVCVVLAGLGLLLPLIPTTPFLLLAAYCFSRSSPRFHNWLLTNRWFGHYLRSYHEGRGLPAREKAITLVTMWLSIGFLTLFLIPILWVRVLLWSIAAGVTIYILRLKTTAVD